MRLLYTIIFCTLFTTFAFAQEQKEELKVVTQNNPGSVQIKWLPTTYRLWINGYQYGYTIERTEVQMLAGKWKVVQKENLTPEPIKAWDANKLKQEAETDPNLRNAELLLMGAKLDAQQPENFNKASELQTQRDLTFIYSLYTSLFRNRAAEAMAVYFEDKTAQPGRTYFYTVSVSMPGGVKGQALVQRNKQEVLTKIPGFKSKNIHKGVELYWVNVANSGYLYYDIYRSSSKNGAFEKLNKRPYVGDVGIILDKNRFMYTDTFPEMGKTYYYKVVANNAFQKQSPPTAVIAVEAKYFLQKAPLITEGKSPDNKNIVLEWGIYPEERPYVKGLSVWHATSGEGKYKKLTNKLLSPETKSYTDTREKKTASNYYTVCAHGIYGDSVCAVLRSVFLIDSIPPASPVIVSGVCDTNGVVKLTWKKGTEPDILGYRVFRSYYNTKEPDRLTIEHISDTTLTDTIEVKSGYKKVYYGVAAIDQHFNGSPVSKYFVVKIPDKNPPSNAVFSTYSTTYDGIELEWIVGPSADLKYQYLVKKSEFDFDWQPLLKLKGDSLKITKYKDTQTKTGVWYQYALIAEDSAGLKSKMSDIYRIQQPEKNPYPIVKNLKVVVSRENKMVKLSWDFDMNAESFKIMRSVKGQPVETYKFTPGANREFYDKWLTPNTNYSYAIIAEIPGGRTSMMSNQVDIKY